MPKGAVFVSYAREDAASAHRIAEALRSHGVEVWFDQDELRGGDAWDAKIRRQVKECSLFLPVVSGHTQERYEGYFRLEWKLAVERTHLMLEGVPFLAPVVIDDTPESGAAAPAEFLRVQWTRLPGALPTPQFVEQVKRLLDSPRKAAPSTRAAGTPASSASAAPAAATPQSAGIPKWLGAMAGIVVLALVGYIVLRPTAKEPGTAAKSVAEMKSGTPAPMPAASAAPKVSAKSIAVLPFAN